MAVGTLRKVSRMRVSPASCSRMAASRWPSNTRINQRELPCGRSLFRENSVAPAVEVQVLGFVADLVERGEAGAQVKVHVAQKGVLRDMEANRDRRRIAVADLEIDVAHRRIKRVGIGIGDVVVGRHRSRRRKRNAVPGAGAAREVSGR